MMNDIVFFSPSTCGAYTVVVHGSDMPDDVVEVAASDWQSLLQELSISAKKMSSRPDGYPVLIDPPPPSSVDVAAVERAWRDTQLAATDGVVTRHRDEQEEGIATTLTAAQYAELQAYRRLLRNWPESGEFPLSDHRPPAPGWFATLPQ
jgi:hypothetical protein